MSPSPSSKVAVGMGTFALFALLGSRVVDVRPIAMHLRGAPDDAHADADVPVELRQEVSEWRARVSDTPALAKNIQELKESHLARTNGRELRDHTIVRAMKRAKAKRPPRFSLEWAKRFEGMNPFEASSDSVKDDASDPSRETEFDRMRRNGQRRGQTIDQIIGIGLAALSPGFPWNPHLAENLDPDNPDDIFFYCAGAELTDPPGTTEPIRPTRDGFMTLINCLDIGNDRKRSQITFEYTAMGELNFTEVSANDPFSDPYGWCVGMRSVGKNQRLRSQYCDLYDMTQVWRILPFDNTWRPDAAWYNINGLDGGLCVETTSSNLTEFVTEMQLERCTYDDQEARQRQTWIWCYEETTCDDEDSTPPNFELTIACEDTEIQDKRCTSATFTQSTSFSDGAGAVPSGIYEEMNECPNDPVRNMRWGRSQVYRVDKSGQDENLVVDFESTCDDDGDDSDTWMRVFTEESDGEWDCQYIDTTACIDRRTTMRAVVDNNNERNYLVVVSADGSDDDDAEYDIELSCSVSNYVLIQLRGDDEQFNLCIGVNNAVNGANLILRTCTENDSRLEWELDRDRLLRLRADNDLCAGVSNLNNNQPVQLFECDSAIDNQLWRYDSRNDFEISLSSASRCMTTENGSNPLAGDQITISACDGNFDQAWNYGRLNPFPSPTPNSDDEYCDADQLLLNVDSDNENLPTGSYDRNACLRESDVFDTTDNLRNTWRYYDTQGIPFTLSVTSDCGSGRGIDDSDSAGYTLYRLYEVDDSGSTTEFECIQSEKTECKEESDGKLTKTFQRLDGSKRYLFVATGSIELVTVCDVSDDCTTEFA